MITKLFFALIGSILMNANAFAALQSATTYVQSVRAESGVVFVSLDTSLPVCGNRVWIDTSTIHGKNAFTISSLAFAAVKPVQVRAYDESQRINGACALFDIQVQNQ